GDRPWAADYQKRFPSLDAAWLAELLTGGAAPPPDPLATIAGVEEPAPALKPLSFGRYRVVKLLGTGGFGTVYQGFDDELQRPVAIKVLHPDQLADVATYLAEARILASLDHPGIVPVYDVGRTDSGECYLVSKLVEGTDLARKIQQGRPSLKEA